MLITGIVLAVLGIGLLLVRPLGLLGDGITGLGGGIALTTVGFIVLVWGVVFVGYGIARKRKTQTTQHLLQNGVRGTVRIANVVDTGVSVNNNPRVNLTLEVYPEGGQPYSITKAVTVSRLAIPRVGDVQPALIDPQDPSKIAFGPELAQYAQAPRPF